MGTRRWLVPTLLILSIAAGVALWIYGASFYTTNPWDRPEHPQHDLLRSSGLGGHGLGLLGTFIILINLSFLVRRHVKAFRRFGALRTWMDSHVITGLLGPLLIVFHSAFHPRSTVAIISAASLGVLVVTGIVGRFIYAMVPHTVAGAEMGRADLEKRLAAASEHLAAFLTKEDPLWARMDALSRRPRVIPKTKIGCLLMLPWYLMSATLVRLRLRSVVWAARQVFPASDSQAIVDIRDMVVIRERLHTLQVYRELLRWWRGMHRIFAVSMIVTVIIHVGVVLYFGYGLPEVGA